MLYWFKNNSSDWTHEIKNLTFFFQVNVIGLSVCTREAYQSMKERNIDDGHIININRYKNVLLSIFFACLQIPACAEAKTIQCP